MRVDQLRGGGALAQPMIAPYYGSGSGETCTSIEAPLPTVTTMARFGLAEPMAVPYGPRAEARSIEDPLPTILTRDRLGLAVPTAAPFLVPNFGERDGQAPRLHTVDEPLPAVTSHGAGALVRPVVVEPVLTKAEMGDVDPCRVVLVNGVPHVLDIRFRMLTNRELARAMGFDDAEVQSEFVGTVEQVTRQIGNACGVCEPRRCAGDSHSRACCGQRGGSVTSKVFLCLLGLSVWFLLARPVLADSGRTPAEATAQRARRAGQRVRATSPRSAAAAESNGLVADDGQRQCWATIRSGLGHGLEHPYDLDADKRRTQRRGARHDRV